MSLTGVMLYQTCSLTALEISLLIFPYFVSRWRAASPLSLSFVQREVPRHDSC